MSKRPQLEGGNSDSRSHRTTHSHLSPLPLVLLRSMFQKTGFHLWNAAAAISGLSKPCTLILIKALADVAPIFWRRIHLSNFVHNGSKISEAGNRSAGLPIQP